MTLGEMFPRLKTLPGYEAIAAGPGLVAMVGNAAHAAVDHALDGGRIAPPEVQAGRETICRACPELDQDRDQCKECGCILMALKRSWASSACPLDPPKWAAV